MRSRLAKKITYLIPLRRMSLRGLAGLRFCYSKVL
jgi:hypothetical protein